MNRSCNISLRISLDLLEKLEKTTKEPDRKFTSVSEAFRSYAELGMKVESFRTLIKDPVFLKSIDELRRTDGIFQWAETLTDDQCDAIARALQMDKGRRYERQELR